MGNLFRRGIEAYKQTMNPAITNGLLKTTEISPEEGRQTDAASGEDSKYRRVAKFLILIGGDRAAEILAELEQPQIEAISREIASIQGITSEEGDEILKEFRSMLSAPYSYSGSALGGIETSRRILYAAFGPEKGEVLLNKAVPDSKENLFGFLETFAPHELALLLKDEASSALALIFSRLPPNLTAASLRHFPRERRLDILKHIARKVQVLPEVLEQVAQGIRERARHISHTETIEINGMQTLAAILKQGDYSFGSRITDELEMDSPEIGRDLREILYTLDDVLKASDRPLQEKLSLMSDKDIAILLKGREKDFIEKILSNVSAGRRTLIREEGEILGAIPKRDCDEAAREFMDWFRQARENGSLVLADDEDVFV